MVCGRSSISWGQVEGGKQEKPQSDWEAGTVFVRGCWLGFPTRRVGGGAELGVSYRHSSRTLCQALSRVLRSREGRSAGFAVKELTVECSERQLRCGQERAQGVLHGHRGLGASSGPCGCAG